MFWLCSRYNIGYIFDPTWNKYSSHHLCPTRTVRIGAYNFWWYSWQSTETIYTLPSCCICLKARWNVAIWAENYPQDRKTLTCWGQMSSLWVCWSEGVCYEYSWGIQHLSVSHTALLVPLCILLVTWCQIVVRTCKYWEYFCLHMKYSNFHS